MHRSLLLSALSALVAKAMAQTSADFINMTWGNVTVGQLWPISWSAANGEAVSLSIGNGTFSSSIFTSLPATPGSYNWTVNVSPTFAAGFYSLALSQTGAGTATSPTFYVSFGDVPPPPNDPSTSASTAPISTVTSTTTIPPPSTTNMTLPTVTVIWYEEECGCTRTSTCDTIAMPTATNGSYAPTTYYEEQCGCSKTAYPAAPTMAPAAANNYTVPAPTAQPAAPVAPAAGTPAKPAGAAYTGGAVKVASAGLGLVGLVAAAFVL